MSGRKRRPGDPYEVGRGKPPKETQYEKGVSGNPNGRPRKKLDLYTDLTRVLNEKVTVTIENEPQRVTVQQALLLRLRDQALRGEIWAGKLLQKAVDAIPDSGGEFDHVEQQVGLFHSKALLMLMVEDAEREKANQSPEPTEDDNDK